MNEPAITGNAAFDFINPLTVNVGSVYLSYYQLIDAAIAFMIFFSLCHWVFKKHFSGREGTMVALGLGIALTFAFVMFQTMSGFMFGGQEMRGIAGIVFLTVLGVLLYSLLENIFGEENKKCALAFSYFITHSILLGTFSPLYNTILQAAPIVVGILAIGYVIALIQVIMCLIKMIGGNSRGGSESSSREHTAEPRPNQPPYVPIAINIINPSEGENFTSTNFVPFEVQITGGENHITWRALLSGPGYRNQVISSGNNRDPRFRSPSPSSGIYNLRIEVVDNTSSANSTRNFSVGRVGGGTGSVRVLAISMPNSIPVTDALITLADASGAALSNARGPFQGRTTSNGLVEFNDVPAGPVMVIANSPSRGPAHTYNPSHSANVTAGAITNVVAAWNAAPPSPTNTLTVTCQNRAGSPVIDAQVEIIDASRRSHAHNVNPTTGKHVFNGVTPGIIIDAKGTSATLGQSTTYIQKPTNVSRTGNTNLKIIFGAPSISLHITAPPIDAPDPLAVRAQGDNTPIVVQGEVRGTGNYDLFFTIYDLTTARLLAHLEKFPNTPAGTSRGFNLDLTDVQLADGSRGGILLGIHALVLIAQPPGIMNAAPNNLNATTRNFREIRVIEVTAPTRTSTLNINVQLIQPSKPQTRLDNDITPIMLEGKITGPDSEYQNLYLIYEHTTGKLVSIAHRQKASSGTTLRKNIDITILPTPNGKKGLLTGAYHLLLTPLIANIPTTYAQAISQPHAEQVITITSQADNPPTPQQTPESIPTDTNANLQVIAKNKKTKRLLQNVIINISESADLNNIIQNKLTDNNGEALFSDLQANTPYTIQASLEGYRVSGISPNEEFAITPGSVEKRIIELEMIPSPLQLFVRPVLAGREDAVEERKNVFTLNAQWSGEEKIGLPVDVWRIGGSGRIKFRYVAAVRAQTNKNGKIEEYILGKKQLEKIGFDLAGDISGKGSSDKKINSTTIEETINYVKDYDGVNQNHVFQDYKSAVKIANPAPVANARRTCHIAIGEKLSAANNIKTVLNDQGLVSIEVVLEVGAYEKSALADIKGAFSTVTGQNPHQNAIKDVDEKPSVKTAVTRLIIK